MAGGDPGPGEGIGPYLVVRRLGSGGMGVVFEAHDTTLGRQVALKVISPQLADDPEFRARFTREAQAQASLDSPHVVHVYAHGEANGRLYLASQLIPDGDLGASLAAVGPPPLPVALDLIAQVASGLADAHAAGLVHRDIKPSNVLLRRRDDGTTAYLSDFGIARQATDVAATRTATVGTPAYMAPELHTGGGPTAAGDVYSLGCLLWATITGAAPYAGGSDFQVASAHLDRPVPQLRGGTPAADAVNAILRRSMAKDPVERYADAGAMRADLVAAARLPAERATPVTLATPGDTVVRASATPERGPSEPRSWVRWWAAAIALAAVLVVAGVLLLRHDAGPAASSTSTDSPPPLTTPSSGSSTSPVSGYQVQPADLPKAEINFSTALVGELGVSSSEATCIATSFITTYTLQRAYDDGFFAQDMTYLNPKLDTLPEAKTDLSAAVLDCSGVASIPGVTG